MIADVMMSHIFHSAYTEKALASIGSERRIFLVDNSFNGDLRVYSRRNPHVVYIRPKVNADRGPPMKWEPLTCSGSWNLAMSRAETPWIFNVNPDVYLWPQSLELLDRFCESAPEEVVMIRSTIGFNVWAGRREWLIEQGGFDDRYRPCGGEDEDMLVRIAKSGKKWMAATIPAMHMDGGHLNRVDGNCNIGTFIEKWGWKPHSPEFNALVGRARQ